VFFVDIRILITPLVSSNSSYKKQEVLNLFDSPVGFHLFKFSVLWCVFAFCLSSVSNIDIVSGLSILDFPFGFSLTFTTKTKLLL